MLLVFNDPSQSGLYIVLSKVSQKDVLLCLLCTILIFSHADTHINNKETNGKSFVVRYNNSQGMQKMITCIKWTYHWLLISFDFWILWISILKNLLVLTLLLR